MPQLGQALHRRNLVAVGGQLCCHARHPRRGTHHVRRILAPLVGEEPGEVAHDRGDVRLGAQPRRRCLGARHADHPIARVIGAAAATRETTTSTPRAASADASGATSSGSRGPPPGPDPCVPTSPTLIRASPPTCTNESQRIRAVKHHAVRLFAPWTVGFAGGTLRRGVLGTTFDVDDQRPVVRDRHLGREGARRDQAGVVGQAGGRAVGSGRLRERSARRRAPAGPSSAAPRPGRG